MRSCFAAPLLMLALVSKLLAASDPLGPGVPPFVLRPGYRVTIAADGIDNARFLCLDDKGTLYVTEPNFGIILAFREKDANGVYRNPTKFVTDKALCQGMQFYQGYLWFTTTGAIYKARDTKGTGVADEVIPVIPEGQLPKGGGHWFRSLLVDDGGFYTSIGDPENASDQTQTDREKIWHYSLSGQDKKLFAAGIRNTEKLLYRPGTREIWGCDHGSDNFGAKWGETEGKVQPITDLNPPDEFNHYVEGGFYGHPFVIATRVPRNEYADRKDIVEIAAKTTAPEWNFGAHWAPNGWTFLTGDYCPGHNGDAFIAFHGSWNRVEKAGYCVERILFDRVTQKPYGSLTIVSTLSKDRRAVLERPVDCVEDSDGSVLFSGDLGNRVYRITRVSEQQSRQSQAQ